MFVHTCCCIIFLYCVICLKTQKRIQNSFENLLWKVRKEKDKGISFLPHHPSLRACSALFSPAGLLLLPRPTQAGRPSSAGKTAWALSPLSCDADEPVPHVSDASFFYLESATSRAPSEGNHRAPSQTSGFWRATHIYSPINTEPSICRLLSSPNHEPQPLIEL
jgi:hypothetical protein